ncbi:hypothetical protein JQX09_02755 [Sulfitobacter pseudonitzschiae]|uniref:Uncharacterized protein n=1 Tax=Pseudosulfitobacter pseudonitzschiae TaxID=1402135 RepID=A0A9Q2NLQ5_9RHOB|nr:hypothetical protein [Pseudosulfitobacter pseudonitzschiae]MBM2290817.1 hypothetical protein [Pseudosulfitobacter pseudonitzschiae]MBM2295735.1 hypothetical protein [Pseudosulfitobacter pseudonitzschiae]MBM2300647.1 hypothetical protein [Pseudosulfitobacter pseudonitzschiae]MBM2310432.1 hypothetical protein [Pseudosulfitobacter pseudonitzschiae]MBM2315344.1 hypothetical protein [Pseudosulfitobacter pseudonitzschiae]
MTLFANRRRMLLGLATATAAAATGVTASGAPAHQEAPELIALADQLDSRLSAYLAAVAKVERIAKEWGPQWPVPVEEIQRWTPGSKQYVNILGNPIEVPLDQGGCKRLVNVGTPECFEKDAASHRREYERKMQTKSQRGTKFHKQWWERSAAAIAPARAFWTEVERVNEASGIKVAQANQKIALTALKDLVGRIVMFQEVTVAGLVIKAQAMQAWGRVNKLDRAVAEFHRTLSDQPVNWGEEMAATIVRQVGGVA